MTAQIAIDQQLLRKAWASVDHDEFSGTEGELTLVPAPIDYRLDYDTTLSLIRRYETCSSFADMVGQPLLTVSGLPATATEATAQMTLEMDYYTESECGMWSGSLRIETALNWSDANNNHHLPVVTSARAFPADLVRGLSATDQIVDFVTAAVGSANANLTLISTAYAALTRNPHQPTPTADTIVHLRPAEMPNGAALVGESRGTSVIHEASPSATMPGLWLVETEHGPLYLDPDLTYSVIQ